LTVVKKWAARDVDCRL